jgi:4-methyl-5(b-hydroxyethyl)-thiazole monophosphate biosynthesis
MGTIYAIIAPGFEEIEAIAVIDILRRADLNVITLGIDSREIEGSHGIRIATDGLLQPFTLAPQDCLFLPGGMPGTLHLQKNPIVADLLQQAEQNANKVAAICAAPTVLARNNRFLGKQITSHPSVTNDLKPYYNYREDRTVQDGNVYTSRGAGTAVEFALYLVAELTTPEKSEAIAKAIVARV